MSKQEMITETINMCIDAVQKSRFGPIFYKIVDGKLVPQPGVGQDTNNPVSMSGVGMEVFKYCLLSELGYKAKVQDDTDGWKRGE